MRAKGYRRTLLLLILALGLSLLACSEADKPAAPNPDDDDPPAGSITVDAAGGLFVLREGRVELEIPAGLFATETTIAVGPLADDGTHPGFFNGTGIDFGASGVALPGAVRLLIHFTAADLPAGMAGPSIDVCRRVAGEWLPQGASAHLDGETYTMEVSTQQLSQQALVALLPADAVCVGETNALVTTMAQLEAYRGCRGIPRGLRIEGPEITSLEALSDLEMIGDLRLRGLSNLTSLAGLESLRRMASFGLEYNASDFDFGVLDGVLVCTSLSLIGCDNLTQLDWAAAIEQLGAVDIQTCHDLESISLPGISRIGRLALSNNSGLQTASFADPTQVTLSFIVSGMPALATLAGLKLAPALPEGLALVNCALLTGLPDGSELVALGGDLRIEHAEALTDLTFLSALETVGGGVVIALNENLVSLAGLEQLSAIAGGITVSANPALDTLGHLHSLTALGGGVDVLDCDALGSLVGLGSLSVAGDIAIIDNDRLVSLAGLGGTASGSLEVERNSRLKSCAGTTLGQLGVGLYIVDNDSLSSLSGLAGVHGYENLEIEANPGLTDLTGLAPLIGLTNVEIRLNSGLTSLHGLESLTEVVTLTISNNENITDCHGLDNLTRVDGTLTLIGNWNLFHLTGLEGLTSVGSLVVQGNQALLDIVGLEHLTRLGWTQPGGGDLRIIDQVHIPNLEPLYGLQPDPATGDAIPGDCVLTGNLGMGNTIAWLFIDAIGGETMVGGQLVIDNR